MKTRLVIIQCAGYIFWQFQIVRELLVAYMRGSYFVRKIKIFAARSVNQ